MNFLDTMWSELNELRPLRNISNGRLLEHLRNFSKFEGETWHGTRQNTVFVNLRTVAQDRGIYPSHEFLDKFWTTLYGKQIKIRDLTDTHLVNIIHFLKRGRSTVFVAELEKLAIARGLDYSKPIPFTYEEEKTPMRDDGNYTFTPLKTATRETAERNVLLKYAAEVNTEEMRLKFGQRQVDTARLYLVDTRMLSWGGWEYKTIQCIKLVRAAFDLGIKEAKELVDSVRNDLILENEK